MSHFPQKSFFIIKTINHQKIAVLPEIRSHYDVSNAKDGVQKVLYGVTAQRILTAKKYVKKTKNTNIKGKGDILILIQLIISHCISV